MDAMLDRISTSAAFHAANVITRDTRSAHNAGSSDTCGHFLFGCHTVFLALTVLNATIYQRIYSRHGGPRLALHLLLISLAALVAGLPHEWGRVFVTNLDRAELIGTSFAGYLLVCAMLSRNPGFGIFGGFVAAISIGIISEGRSGNLHWALESGIVFVLLHSLRWLQEKYTDRIRVFICVAWVTHAFIWMHTGGLAWMACAIVIPVLAAYFVGRLMGGRWQSRILPLAAILVAFSGPADSFFSRLRTAPVGVLAVMGSFLLFALGTLTALTKLRAHS